MKKHAVIPACMLVCLTLLTGCTAQNDSDGQGANWGSSAEIDDTDIGGDVEARSDAGNYPDNADLPDGFTYSFKDPDNADGIVVTPRE